MTQFGMFMKRGGLGGGLLVASLLATACTATDDGEGEGDPGSTVDPLARVELANGATVAFFETAPGAIGIAQDFDNDQSAVPTDGKSAVEVYESIAPGEPVPAALLAAQQRADAARASRPHAAHPASAEPETSSISDADFISKYCSGSWDVIQYLPLHRNYPSSYGNNDADEVKFTACANVGNVTMRAFIDGDLKGPWDILDNYCISYHWTSGWLNEVVSADVYNVQSTDRYDFCMLVNH